MDIYTQYEAGIQALLRQLPGNHPRYAEVLAYREQLRDNVKALRRYDDDDQGERLWLLEQLDEIAYDVTGSPFHELCSYRPPASVPDEHYLLASIVAGVVALMSASGLWLVWQGNQGSFSTLMLAGGLLLGWAGYLYLAFRERDTGARREAVRHEDGDIVAGMRRVKVAYYPAWMRRGALGAILVISVLALVAIR